LTNTISLNDQGYGWLACLVDEDGLHMIDSRIIEWLREKGSQRVKLTLEVIDNG